MKLGNFKERLKSKNGVSIVALVITIIVMLILAGVAIGIGLNNNSGIVGRANEMKFKSELSELKKSVDEKIISRESTGLHSVGTKEIIKEALGEIDLSEKIEEKLEKILDIQDEELVYDEDVADNQGFKSYEKDWIEEVGIRAKVYGDEYNLSYSLDSNGYPYVTKATVTITSDIPLGENKIKYFLFSDKIDPTTILPNEWLNYENPITVDYASYIYTKVVDKDDNTISSKISVYQAKYEYNGHDNSDYGDDIEIADNSGEDGKVDTRGPETEVNGNGETWKNNYDIVIEKDDDNSEHDIKVIVTDEEAGVEISTTTTFYQWVTSGDKPSNNLWIEYTNSVQNPTGTGVFDLYIKIIDEIGNETVTKIKTIRIDKTAPITPNILFTLEDGSKYDVGTWTNQNINVTITGNDEHSGVEGYEYSEDGGSTWKNITEETSYIKNGKVEKGVGSFTIAYNDKVETISFRTIDNAGNESNSSAGYEIKMDKINPEYSESRGDYVRMTTEDNQAYNGSWTNQSVTAVVRFTDNNGSYPSKEKQYMVSIDNKATWTDMNYSNDEDGNLIGTFIFKNTDYSGKVYIKSIDNAGNSAEINRDLKIDKIKPDVPTVRLNLENANGTAYTAGNWTNKTVVATLTSNDTGNNPSGIKQYRYSTDNGATWRDVPTSNGVGTLEITKEVNLTYIFDVTDNAGNISNNTGNYNIKIDKTVPNNMSVSPSAGATYIIPNTGKDMAVNIKFKEGKPNDPKSVIIKESNNEKGTGSLVNYGTAYVKVTNNDSDVTYSNDGTWFHFTSGNDLDSSVKNAIKTKGTYYFHIRFMDYAGNEKYQTFGPYYVVNPEESFTVSHTPATDWTQTATVNVQFENYVTKNKKYGYATERDRADNNKVSIPNNAYSFSRQETTNGWVFIKVGDAAGNTAELTNYQITNVDNLKPQVVSMSINNVESWKRVTIKATVKDQDQTIASGCSGVRSYMFTQNPAVPASDSNDWVDANNSEGTKQINIESTGITETGAWYLFLKDAAGNISEASNNSIQVTETSIDKVAPRNLAVEAHLDDENGEIYDGSWTNHNIYVKLTGEDPNGIQTWQWYEQGAWSTRALTTTNSVGTITLNYNRNTTLRFRAIDPAGNISEEITQVIKTDYKNPTISVDPENSELVKNKNVTITIGDVYVSSGLASDNSYQYALSTSNETAPSSGWTNYTNGTANTIGTDLNGTYYLWVKQVADNATNISTTGGTKVGDYHVFGPYVFDNIPPEVIITGEATGITDGLIRYFDGNNNLGNGHSDTTTTWKDLSGNNDGTVNGAKFSSDGYATFDGVNDWVNLGQTNDLSQVTVQAEVNFNSIQSGEKCIIANCEGGGYIIELKNGAPLFAVYVNGDYRRATYNEPVVANRCYTLTGTYDGNTVRLYVDGILYAETAYSGTISNPAENTVAALGANPVGTNRTQGYYSSMNLYAARIYNRALSQAEIKQNMNADRIKPSIDSTTNHGSVNLSIVFNEDVTGLTADDFTGTNCTIGTLTGSGSRYTLSVTGILVSKTMTVALAENSYTDVAGNNGPAKSILRYRDRSGPNSTITSLAGDITKLDTVTYRIKTQDKWVYGFNTDDISVTNGTIVSLTRTSEKEYELVVSNSGTCEQTISFNENVFYDRAGNGNEAASKTITIDRDGPVASISSTNNLATSQTVTLSMSDSPAGVSQYYWGTSNPENETVTWVDYTENNVTQTVSDGGTYYFGIKDTLGNMTVVSKDFYKTTLTVNNGSSVSPAYVVTMEGNSFTLPTPTTVAGYTFSGWYTTATEGTKVGDAGASYTPTATTILQGQWTANNYDITYDLDGGAVATANPTTYTIESSDITLNNPTRTGYTFAGWTEKITNLSWHKGFVTQETGEIVDSSTYPYSYYTDLIRVRSGEKITVGGFGDYYTRTSGIRIRVYKLNGEFYSGNHVMSLNAGGDYYIRVVFYRESTEEERNGSYISVTPNNNSVTIPTGSTGNRSYTANWTANDYTVNYNYNYNEFTTTDGTSVGVARTYDPSTNIITLNGDYNSGQTHTLKWIANKTFNVGEIYTLKAEYVSGTLSTTNYQIYIALDIANNGSVLSPRIKDDYTINNLATVGTKSEDLSITETAAAGNGLRFILWRAADNTVLFDNYQMKVTVTRRLPQTVTYNTAYGQMPTPTREGYTFLGWYTAETGGDLVSSSTVMNQTDTHTLYAHWTRDDYTISYNLDGGYNVVNPTTYNVESDEITLLNPVKPGYSFTGWTGSNGDTAQTEVTISTGSTGNKSYTANWTKDNYTISYDLDGGSVASSNPSSYSVDSSVITLNNPTKEGYTFSDWTEKISNLAWYYGHISYDTGKILYNSTYPNSYFTDPIKLSAGKTYTITGYNSQNSGNYVRWRVFGLDGSYLGSKSNYNSYTPSQDCYAILMYHNSSSQSARENTVINVTPNENTVTIPTGSVGDRTYTANWTANEYTITYDYNGLKNYAHCPGSFSRSYNGGTNVLMKLGKMYVDDLELGDEIRISFDAAYTDITSVEGETAKFQLQCSGNVTSYSTELSKRIVREWTGTGTETCSITTTMTANKLTNDYFTMQIRTDNCQSGSIIITNVKVERITTQTATLTYGNTLGTLPDPSEVGYSLVGWYTDPTGGTEVTSSTPVPAANTTYYAHWTRNSYTLTYDYNGETTFKDGESSLTGYTIDWEHDFTLSGTFNIPSLGKRYLLIGSYGSDSNKSLNLEINTSNKIRVWTASSGAAGHVEYISTNSITENEDINVVLTWNASTKQISCTAIGTQTDISVSGSASMSGSTTGILKIGTEDHRGSVVFNPITAKNIRMTKTVLYNDSISLLNSERIGYTLDGWYTAAIDGTKLGANEVMPAQDTTIYAHWTANQYDLTYMSGNLLYGLEDCSDTTSWRIKYSIENKTVSVTSLGDDGNGTTSGRVYLEANKTYVFSCDTTGTWGHTSGTDTVEAYLCKDGLSTTGNFYGMNTRVYEFTPSTSGTYWLRLDVNENEKTYTFSNISVYEKARTDTKEYGTTLGTLPSVSRTGYTLDGWYTEKTDGTEVTSSTPVPAGNTTYYAHWIKNNYQNTTSLEYYETLADAFDEVEDGETIKVLDSVTETEAPELAQDISAELDLNGKTTTLDDVYLTNNGTLSIYSSDGNGVLQGDGTRVIVNNGTLKTNDGLNNVNEVSLIGTSSLNSYVILTSLGADTVLNTNTNVTFNTALEESVDRYLINTNGTTTINGANLTNTITNGVGGCRGIHLNNVNSKLIVNSGHIETISWNIFNFRGKGSENTYAVTISGTDEGTVIHSRGGYAVYNANSGNRAQNVLISGGTMSTGTGMAAVYNGLGTTDITGGRIISGNSAYAIENYSTGTVNISGGYIYSSNKTAIYDRGNTCKLNVSGGTIIGANGIYNNGSTNTVNVTGGSITGTTGSGISSRTGTTTVSGSTTSISGTTAGVYVTTGSLEVTGGTISASNGNGIKVDDSEGSVTIGSDDSSVSTVSPSITGTTHGVEIVDGAEFNFYDGVINGPVDGSISGDVADTPDDYVVVKTTANSVESAKLYKEYDIEYDLDGGTVSSANPTTYTQASSAITLNNPTKTGYTFSGWTVGKNLLDYNDVTEYALTHGITVDQNDNVSDSTPGVDDRGWSYAARNWGVSLEAGTYTLTFDFSQQCTQGHNKVVITKDDGSWISDYIDIQNKDEVSYTFTLNEATNIGIEAKLYNGVCKVQLEKGSEYTGFEPYIATPSTTTTIQAGSTGNRTYVANWTANEYTITYDYNGVKNYFVPNSSEITYSGFTGATNECIYLGTSYKYNMTDGDRIRFSCKIEYEDLTCDESKNYFLKFQGRGDVSGWNTGAIYVENITGIKGTGEQDYTFDWNLSSNNLTNNSFTWNLRADYYTGGTIKISDVVITRVTRAKSTVTYGNTLGTLPSPVEPGYTLVGWYTEPTGGTEVTSSTTVPLNGATYYAHWYKNLAVGDTVSYSPTGSYNWNKEYATGNRTGTETLSSASGSNFRVTSWKVLSIDENTGEVELVPENVASGTVELQGAMGYNNGVKLLNDACSALYSDSSVGATARSINEEDFVEAGGNEWTTARDNYSSGYVSYGEQKSSAYSNSRYYPAIYALEQDAVIDGDEKTGYTQSQQTDIIEKTENGMTTGFKQATTSIQPYQTVYEASDYETTAGYLGTMYSSILLPSGGNTSYWVASRCINNASLLCSFRMFYINSGCWKGYSLYSSSNDVSNSVRSLFPVVTLNSSYIVANNSGVGYTANQDKYTVTLDNQGATTAGTEAIYLKYNVAKYYSDSNTTTEITDITVPTKTGYVFGGYYSEPNGQGTQYVEDDGDIINNLYSVKTYDMTLYAKWTRDVSLYGKYVDIGVDINNDGDTTNDFRLFLDDGDNMYLIAADYIPNSMTPESKGGNSVNTDGDYKACFTNVIGDYTGSGDIVNNSKLSGTLSKYHKWVNANQSSTNNNIKAVAYLLDTDAWGAKFINNSNSNYIDYVIGGPTLEMFADSYNAKHANDTDFETAVKMNYDESNNTGYMVSRGSNTLDTYNTGFSTADDNLYFYNKSSKPANHIWLASPSNGGEYCLMNASGGGGIYNDTYWSISMGFRPVVCLKSGVDIDSISNNVASIEKELEVGDVVSYSPSGTYTWDTEYATSDTTGTVTLSSAEGGSFRVTSWRVLSIDENTGEVQLVPENYASGTVRLQGAMGYNNAVKMLNDACYSLYSDSSVGAVARSINEEDFIGIGGSSWTTIRNNFTNYGEQPYEYTTNKNYPVIYAQEEKAVIDGVESSTGLSKSQQTAFINRAEGTSTSSNIGAITTAISIQPYQTDYNTVSYAKTSEILGTTYSDILLPDGDTTNYLVASRYTYLYTDHSSFGIHVINNGRMDGLFLYKSNSSTTPRQLNLFPIVTINSSNIVSTGGAGFEVQASPLMMSMSLSRSVNLGAMDRGLTTASLLSNESPVVDTISNVPAENVVESEIEQNTEINESTEAEGTEDTLPTYPIEVKFDENVENVENVETKLVDDDGTETKIDDKEIKPVKQNGNEKSGITVKMPKNEETRIDEDEKYIKEYTFIGWFDEEYKDMPLKFYVDSDEELQKYLGYETEEEYNKNFEYDEEKIWEYYNERIEEESKKPEEERKEIIIAQYEPEKEYSFTENKTLYAGWVLTKVTEKPKEETKNEDDEEILEDLNNQEIIIKQEEMVIPEETEQDEDETEK
ncbi:MAG: InlB B-repeat-containing protein [Clostridia bacterium]|nr:InlB B-repeat-containing protein [Clostridia bacterium]